MVNLNLPAVQHQVKKADGKLWIFDILRKKYMVLTPEEWVRQHFVHYLITTLSYPKALIKLEGGLTYNQLAKRSDIVVFSRSGSPWMVVECKSPDVPIDQSTLRQASLYNTTLKARYLVVTNGMAHYFFSIDWENNTTNVLERMPVYDQE